MADSKFTDHVFCQCFDSGIASDTLLPSPTFAINPSISPHLDNINSFNKINSLFIVQSEG